MACPEKPSSNRTNGTDESAEVVDASPNARNHRDNAVEHWLREEVAVVYDALKANPTRARSMEEVFGEIRAKHARKLVDRP
jgi:antitoxin ParD1/3/4